MDKEEKTQSKGTSSSPPVAPEMQNVEEEKDDQIQNPDNDTTTTAAAAAAVSDDVVATEQPEAGGSSSSREVPATTSGDIGPPTKWPKDKRGRGKIGAQAAAETLTQMMLTGMNHDVASSGSLLIQEVKEEPSPKKPRLDSLRMTYDCCACNTSFSNIQDLTDHMPSHRQFDGPAADFIAMQQSTTTSHGDDGGDEPQKETRQDDDGKGKGVYIQPEVPDDDDDDDA